MKRTRGRNKTVQDRAIELYEFVNKYGRSPMSNEISNTLKTHIVSNFNSYDEGLIHYGLIPLSEDEKVAISRLRTESKWKLRILELYKETGVSPTIKGLKEKYGRHPPASITNKFSNILEELGMEVNKRKLCYNYSPEQCIEIYLNICDKLGKVANSEDISNDEDSPTFLVLIKDFGSLRNLQKAAGVDIISEEYYRYNKSDMKEDIKKCYKYLGDKIFIRSKLQEALKNEGCSYCISTIERYFRSYGNDYNEIISKIIEA